MLPKWHINSLPSADWRSQRRYLWRFNAVPAIIYSGETLGAGRFSHAILVLTSRPLTVGGFVPRLGLLSRDRLPAAAVTSKAAGEAASSAPSRMWILLRRGRILLAGTALISAQIVLLAGVYPAWAVCDANTAGVSVCSGTDAAVVKTATGNLDVQFNNETVTVGGVN